MSFREKKIQQAIVNIEQLLQSGQSPETFWPDFLKHCAALCNARLALLFRFGNDGTEPMPVTSWQETPELEITQQRLTHYARIASNARNNGYAQTSTGFYTDTKERLIAGVRIQDYADNGPALCAVFDCAGSEPVSPQSLLGLIARLPEHARWRLMLAHSQSDIIHFAGAIDSIGILYGEKKFQAAAMALCNEISSRYSCARVSLGWKKQAYIRLYAMSHIEKFDKRMEAVAAMEFAMEEAMDQDVEIQWPTPDPGNSGIIARAHETFSRRFGSDFMVSVPLRVEDTPVAVITCERANTPFSEVEITGLRLLCDLSVHRLADLKKQDAWFGKRIWEKTRDGISSLLGVEHTLAKLIGIVVSISLMYIIFARWDYKVRADFNLKTDELAYITAPFDGYIEDVYVENGDIVKKNAPLLKLDTTELILNESKTVANIQAYDREAEKDRAENRLAEMSIALAKKKEAQSELGLIRYLISRSTPTGPFPGIIVKGERQELLGRPVKKGDILLEEARLERMYPEISVDEADIQEIKNKMSGKIAFLSRPEKRFPIRIDQINPSAKAEKEGNIFLVKATPLKRADWWRPGMTGVAEIDVGRRTLLWILTHRTLDFFRLHLWW